MPESPPSSESARRAAEGRVVVWAASAFFCLLAATFVIRPVRDAWPLDGDTDRLPELFTGTLIATLVLAPAWGWVLGKFPRVKFVATAYHVVALCLVGFAVMVETTIDPAIAGRVFYIWAAVANLFVVSVFWSVCADVLGPTTARRLYGRIAVGGTAGAIAGPLIAKVLSRELGVYAVLIAAAFLLELAVLAIGGLQRAGRALADTDDAGTEDPVPGGAIDGLRDVGRSPYLGGIAAYAVFTACAATFVYLEQAGIVKAAFATRDARTEYFATVDLWTNIGVLVIQALATGPLLAVVGVGGALAILPLLQSAGLVALLAAPSLATLVAAQIASRIAQHAIARPGRELLFTVVPRDAKYRAKNVIDTLVYRAGDSGSAWLHFGLVHAGLGGVTLLAFALPLNALWLGTAILLGVGFRRRKRLV